MHGRKGYRVSLLCREQFDFWVDGETVLVCLAQEMAILLHKLYTGNLSKLNEEQRNRCLTKTEGCIVSRILKSQDQKQKMWGRPEITNRQHLTAFVLLPASSDLLPLITMFSRYLNQNKSTHRLVARLGREMYFFWKPGVLPPRETAKRLVMSSQATSKSSWDSKVAVVTISRQKYSEIMSVDKGCPQLSSWDGLPESIKVSISMSWKQTNVNSCQGNLSLLTSQLANLSSCSQKWKLKPVQNAAAAKQGEGQVES